MTSEQYKKREATLIQKYGHQGYKELKREWAKQGGQKSTGGFKSMSPEERSEYGRRGGSVKRITDKNK